ncbi:MAG TPA: hypothetical protein VN674_12720 [Gemmatimonadales bacterium]|nr:hypothetical protein [Gemmatimonadales bacterium]
MSWIVAGLIGGFVAWIADYVLWSKVFTKGMENLALELSPEEMKKFMGPAMLKSAVLAFVFGILFAYLYQQFRSDLWVTGGGILGGMEFATVLWLPTIALQTLGSGVWYVKARGLLSATFWAWLIRMNAVGLVVGLLLK